MSNFEKYLMSVHDKIKIDPESRPVYTKNYESIRDHIIGDMQRTDKVFDKWFIGCQLFGNNKILY